MSKSMDRYLYAIRTLKDQYLCVRAVDVAHFLGLSQASVSIALRQMRDQDLIIAEPDGNLLFTAGGLERADKLLRRVSFFRQILTDAGVDPIQALQDAVAFSWEMSDVSFAAFESMNLQREP